jgi:MFS family permease
MSLAYWTLLGAFPEMAIAQGVSSSEAFAANTVGLLVMMMLLPLFAMASDRFGRRTVLGGGLLAQAVVVVPALFILEHNPSSVIFIQIAVAIPAAAIEGALYATLVEKFPARLRGVGMGLSMALGVALLGGTSPLVQTAMTNAGIPLWGFGLYVLTVLLLAGVLALRMPETAHMPLRIA